MRRLVLRTLMLSLLAIGIASAARVKHTVDLPTNPLHWQRYLKTLFESQPRSVQKMTAVENTLLVDQRKLSEMGTGPIQYNIITVRTMLCAATVRYSTSW